MSSVDPQLQLEFLSNIQRLLGEGQFTATYKYALLLAIADICVEDGDGSDSVFVISTQKIAEKYIVYYWPQVRPYQGSLLRQNTGKTPAVIRTLEQIAARGVVGLTDLKQDAESWKRLVRDVDRIVREMPLWKLQTVGGHSLEFLYENSSQAGSIELKPGVMFCFRRFHELITDLVRGAWVRYVRRFNRQVLGTPTDLDEFLFGTQRASLEKYLPILREVQQARCLYCEREVQVDAAHIDHFIPWARYPIDLGHNFVLAHNSCNSAKAEHLAALVHLDRWVERNRLESQQLRDRFDSQNITHNAETSKRIARWAYSIALETRAMAWLLRSEFEPIAQSYLDILQ
jgi:HNH endonuclease